jgi:hypothetical protein
MKKINVGLLALSLLAGGITAASAAAASGEVGATYDETVSWAAPASFLNVDDLRLDTVGTPLNTTNNFFLFSSTIETDGAGKIEGVAQIRMLQGGGPSIVTSTTNIDTTTTPPTTNVDNETNVTTAGALGFSDFIADISGKVGSKAGVSTVTLTIKGNGYSGGSSNPPDFGTTAAAKPAKLSLKFTSTGGATTVSNDEFDVFTAVPGSIKGTVTPGLATISKKPIKVDETGTLAVSQNTVSNLFLAMVQIGNKVYSTINAANVDPNFPFEGGDKAGNFSGKGSVSAAAVKISYKGVGSSRGSSFVLSGAPGAVAGTDFTGDTVVTNTIPNAIATSIELKGKIKGQPVDAKGGTAAGPNEIF